MTAVENTAQAPQVPRSAVVEEMVDALSGGRSVVLTGGDGSGKTRILGQVVADLRGRGVHVVTLSAVEGFARVPFGAFLGLTPPHETGPAHASRHESLASLDRSARRIASRAAQLGLDVIAVDDAHRLDPYSAGLILDLVRSGRRLLVTSPAHRDLPAALQDVDHDRMKAFCLEPLDETRGREMLEELLGGVVDPSLVTVFVTAARGMPLHLSEIVNAARAAGAIRRADGGWVLGEPAGDQPSLAAAVRLRLASVSPAARRSLEASAIAEPLAAEIVIAVSREDRLAELTRAGLLVRDPTGRVRTAHSLFRRTILADLPRLRRRSIVLQLIELLDAGDRVAPLGDAERVLRAMLRAEVGRPQRIDEVLALVDLVAESDPATAERLLLGAIGDSTGRPAMLRLADLYAHQHRSAEAVALLDAIERSSASDEEITVAFTTHAFLLAQPLNDPQGALDVLDSAESRLGRSHHFDVVRSTALWRSGSLPASLAISEPISEDETLPAHVRAHAALDRQAAATMSGDPGALATAMTLAARWASRAGAALPEAQTSQELLSAKGQLLVFGELDAAESIILRGIDRALLAGDEGVRLQWSNEWGWLEFLRGRVATAAERLEAARTAQGIWASIMRSWIVANSVRALVATESIDHAAMLLDGLERIPRTVLYDTDVALAEAAVFAGRGFGSLAARVCRTAALAAERHGLAMMAIQAWYEGVLLGDAVAASGLITLLERMPGAARVARNRAMHRHATALRSGDRAGLDLAAVDFRAVGHHLYADCIERTSDVRMRGSALTDREAQLALLAARGRSDREIASALGLSVRTIGTHLSRAYSKLGVTGRADLLLRPERPR
jgi:DNA-binding CsgD family transcriptional regulator